MSYSFCTCAESGICIYCFKLKCDDYLYIKAENEKLKELLAIFLDGIVSVEKGKFPADKILFDIRDGIKHLLGVEE